MIINGKKLLEYAPIKGMATRKLKVHGTSYGLSEAGYDIRIKQDIRFVPKTTPIYDPHIFVDDEFVGGRFTLASAIEEFQMPPTIVGKVHDKSTWARHGVSVFNTVIEPNWKGFLTLELVFHGNEEVFIPAGAGIAQVLFFQLTNSAYYDGKYQNQEDKPIKPIMEGH